MRLRTLAATALLLLPSPSLTAQTPAGPAPLPDIHTLIDRVRERYKELETLRKSYIFTITEVADEFSSNGSKKTHTDVFQAFFVRNTEVRQHISRDGQPLSPGDAKKEQERVDKLVAELKAGKVKHEHDNISLSASGLLKVAVFSNARREQHNGRPVLAFDYKGDPHAHADDIGQQIMRDLAGTLWVDERDSAILRLTGTLQDNFHVAGGLLVNIKKGSRFDFTQAPVNGEIWFPEAFAAHVDGRFLLLKGFNGDAHLSFSDYRKLKTSVTILPGSHMVDENGQPQPEPPPSSTPTQPTGPPVPPPRN
ncbi:MAG TPA: hypothetical protein VM865_02000 [Acidobacteriaceae bacterium]|jgi:hypothetical protein|nr:hypothetical protein [Acidobacteriaceae bacterium]